MKVSSNDYADYFSMVMFTLTYLIVIVRTVTLESSFDFVVRLLNRKNFLKTKLVWMYPFTMRLSHFDFPFDELFSNEIVHQHFLHHLLFSPEICFFIDRHWYEDIFVFVDYGFRDRIVVRFEFVASKNKKMINFVCSYAE